VTAEDADNWKRAIDEDLQAQHGTWTFEDLPEGRKTIGSKWVFKKKYVMYISTDKSKARLCAKGFTPDQGIDYQKVCAPVARYDSIWMMLALAAQRNMGIGHFYVRSPFLNGDLIKEVLVEIPEGITT